MKTRAAQLRTGDVDGARRSLLAAITACSEVGDHDMAARLVAELDRSISL